MSLGYTPHFIYKVYIFLSPNCLPYETRWEFSCTSVSPPPARWLCRPLVLAALQCPLSPPPLAGIPSSSGHQFPIMLCSRVGLVGGSGPRRTCYVSPRSTSRSCGTEMACEQCSWLLASAHSASAPGWVPADRWSCLDTEACIIVPTRLCLSLSEDGLCPKLPILDSFGTDSLELLSYSSTPEGQREAWRPQWAGSDEPPGFTMAIFLMAYMRSCGFGQQCQLLSEIHVSGPV